MSFCFCFPPCLPYLIPPHLGTIPKTQGLSMTNASDNINGIRFVTWNVKGVNNPNKRSKVFTHIKRLKSDIIFLQETHLRDKDHAKLRCPWIGHIFHSIFNSRARGVAILISKKLPFIETNSIADKNGRYLIIVGTIYGFPILLVNV